MAFTDEDKDAPVTLKADVRTGPRWPAGRSGAAVPTPSCVICRFNLRHPSSRGSPQEGPLSVPGHPPARGHLPSAPPPPAPQQPQPCPCSRHAPLFPSDGRITQVLGRFPLRWSEAGLPSSPGPRSPHLGLAEHAPRTAGKWTVPD